MLARRRPRLRLAPDTLPEPEGRADADRVDELLQKIFESGEASLTDEERAAIGGTPDLQTLKEKL